MPNSFMEWVKLAINSTQIDSIQEDYETLAQR